MLDWMEGGVELGWLIDGDRQTVLLYRAGRKHPEKRQGLETIAGEGSLAGFELDLTEIWEGL